MQDVIWCLTVEQCSWLSFALLSNDIQWLRAWSWWLGLLSAACTPDRQQLSQAQASLGSHSGCINDRGICAGGAQEALAPSPKPPFPNETHRAASLTTLPSCYWLPRGSKKSTFTFQSEEAEVDVRDRDTERDTERKRARGLTLRDSCTDNSMQFGTRPTATESGFMGTWQNADTNLLYRMSQQVCDFTFDATRWSACLFHFMMCFKKNFSLPAFHFCLILILHSFWSVIT